MPTPPVDINKLYVTSDAPIKVTKELKIVLQKYFETAIYERVHLVTEFGAGLTQSRVFKVLAHRRGFPPELPQVVKIGNYASIYQEKKAYEQFVERHLNRVARIIGDTCHQEGNSALICYELVNDPNQPDGQVYSLKEFFKPHYTSPEGRAKFRNILNQLLKTANFWWRYGRPQILYQMLMDYDLILPVNFVIHWLDHPPKHEEVLEVSPDNIPHDLQQGGYVCLQDFKIMEVDAKNNEVTLNGAKEISEGLVKNYRVKLIIDRELDKFVNMTPLPPIYGMITATRQDLLTQLIAQVLNVPLTDLPDLKVLPGGPVSLPNPLIHYLEILQKIRNVDIAIIHGDLNLENVLITSDNDIKLIDFADTRLGHVLHDLLRLETGVMTYLLVDILAKNPTLAVEQTVYNFYNQLHQALRWPDDINPDGLDPHLEPIFEILLIIRRAASAYFQDQLVTFQEVETSFPWQGLVEEYYPGLVIYLLAALKFKNLDQPTHHAPLPKKVALWGAATLIHLINNHSERPAPPEIDTPKVVKKEVPFWQTLLSQISSGVLWREGYKHGIVAGKKEQAEEIMAYFKERLSTEQFEQLANFLAKTE